MSQAILTLLREHTAFKPKPPEYELALAHVPLGQVGLENPIDDRLLEAMCAEDESFTIVLAPPGCGKSSALSAAAMHAAKRDVQPRILPLRVPVGHHTAPLDAVLLVRAVASELANQLAPLLEKRPRERLERALATTISHSRQGTRISLALNAVAPHSPIGASLGVQLAGDLTTLTSQAGWQGSPHAGLLALRDIADARNARLVVIFDDTDTWSEGDEEMALSRPGLLRRAPGADRLPRSDNVRRGPRSLGDRRRRAWSAHRGSQAALSRTGTTRRTAPGRTTTQDQAASARADDRDRRAAHRHHPARARDARTRLVRPPVDRQLHG